MHRRGFLGSLAAALAATKLAPSFTSGGIIKSTTPPMLASGVVRNEFVAPVDGNMYTRGYSITVPDEREKLGWHTQHLGESGKLVARSFPDGRTEIYDMSDVTVVRSLFK